MDRWEGKVAVVTGSSSGIGAAIAEELVKAGVVVVGLARRLEKLEELSASLKGAKGKFHARQCDLRKEEDILGAFKWANAELGGVDILVNNAGVGTHSKAIDDETESFRKILDVNVLAMAIATREAVASLKNRDAAGHIININSVTGHTIIDPKIPYSLYTASKWAVTALTETVRKELANEDDRKIRITSISPGFVKTEMIQAWESSMESNIFESFPALAAKDIADATLYVLGAPQQVQVTELTIRPTGESF